MSRPVHFTVYQRAKPRARRTKVPLCADLETYPSYCEGCGKRCTANSGFVELTDALGSHKWCRFGCGSEVA